MVPTLILIIFLFSLLLIKSADFVVIALRRISKQTKTGLFALSAIILALGTSLPELFVGITSAIEKSPNLALGVIIGSNIANVALVGSLAALLAGRVVIRGEYLKREVGIAFVAGILPILLVADGTLGRVDGLILLSTYFAYAAGFFKKRYEEIGREQQEESFFYRFVRRFNHVDSRETKEFARLFVGIALLLFSADVIVKLSVALAQQANIPLFVVGLFVIAVGTSLPELAFSVRSLTDHEPSMFFGNLLGSTIANSTLVIGVAATIHPIRVLALDQYLSSVVFFTVIFFIFWIFIRTKHRLDRWEAALMLFLYTIFVVIEFV